MTVFIGQTTVMPNPWLGGIARPIPGGMTRPMPGTIPRPYPGGTIDIGPVIGPVTQPGDIITNSQTKGDAIAKPTDMARDLTESNNNRRKKDCRCRASFTCEGSVSIQNRGEAGLEYQLHIANLRSAPILFTKTAITKIVTVSKASQPKQRFEVTEWRFGGVNDWDGFWLSACTLVEAKGNYGFMRKILRLLDFQINKWLVGQIIKHQRAIKPYQKTSKDGRPVKAQWHFQDKEVWSALLKKMGIKGIAEKKKDGLSFHHTPYETEKDRKKREEQEKKELERFYQEHPELRA